jgi:plastocyanin
MVDRSDQPQKILEGYFTTANHDINPIFSCGFPFGTALSADGTVLYLAFWGKLQVYDLSACLNPVEAEAKVEVPDESMTVFPGDPIEIRNTSTGSYDEFWLWVTKEFEGGASEVVAGWPPDGPPADSNTVQLGDQTLAMEAGVQFVAHVRVANDDPPPKVAEYSKEIANIRTDPRVTPVVGPAAIIQGEPATLSVTDVQGQPQSYRWVLRDPDEPEGEETYAYDGAEVPATDLLNKAGEWSFELTVTYPHESAEGVPYTYVAKETLTVGPVAAAFTVSPDPAWTTKEITLDGSVSRPQDKIVTYKWVITGPSQVTCDVPSPSSCVINSDFDDETKRILPGDYKVELTVTNADDVEASFDDTVTVFDGSVAPEIQWSESPTEGKLVQFTILGTGDKTVTAASWDFGEDGCGVSERYYDCDWTKPGANCSQANFIFASGGAKTVRVTVTAGGTEYQATPAVFDVIETGEGCGTASCSYSVSPSSANIVAAGDTKSFSVSAAAGCSWSASESLSWVNITAGKSGNGNGQVTYQVSANSGGQRNGVIVVSGENSYRKEFAVVQNGVTDPAVPVDFAISNSNPERGETITFSADSRLQILSWDFGGANCSDQTQIQCQITNCNPMPWAYKDAGQKTVTMTLADGSTKQKTVTVRNAGGCCYATSPPSASFTMSATKAYVGDTVEFTANTEKALKASNLSLKPSTSTAGVGEKVTFTIEGLDAQTTSSTQTSWNFGGAGCDDPDGLISCPGQDPYTCRSMKYAYAQAGTYTIKVKVMLNGSTDLGELSLPFTVAGGSGCGSDGGDPVCQYALSPSSRSFSADGGSGTFNVTTSSGCAWSAASSDSWLSIANEGQSFSGNGTVSYSVGPNSGANDRTGKIVVAGKTHWVYQDGVAVPGAGSEPTAWSWTISRKNEDAGYDSEATRAQSSFSYEFEQPGEYRVQLVTSNCRGSSQTATQFVTILDNAVEHFVVGAASSTDGSFDTHWESDFRFFNPCDESVSLTLKFFPDLAGNPDQAPGNTGPLTQKQYEMTAYQTLYFSDIRQVFPDLGEDAISGSVLVDASSADNCKAITGSRTYNGQPDGSSYGALYVPAMPKFEDTPWELLDFTGLIRNDAYRTNLRLVNYDPDGTYVPLVLLDRHGEVLEGPNYMWVPGHSAKQRDDVAGFFGISGSLDLFTVQADTRNINVDGFATVIDNISSDAVLNRPSEHDVSVAWVPGVAYTEGKNETFWQTDVWVYNPDSENIASIAEYVIFNEETETVERHSMADWPYLLPGNLVDRPDIARQIMDGEQSSGYLVVRNPYGGSIPLITARTYIRALDGGTLGARLPVFVEDDLLAAPDVVFVAGVRNSADRKIGYRTNVGLLNTDPEDIAGVRLTFFDTDGTDLRSIERWIEPSVLQNFNLFVALGLGDRELTGSVMIEIMSGTGVAVYASEIDNQTGDSILMPALPRMFGKQVVK